MNYRITRANNAVTTLVIKLFGAEIISSLDKEQTSASYLLFMNSSEELKAGSNKTGGLGHCWAKWIPEKSGGL